jgi:signal transduction histidine kinase
MPSATFPSPLPRKLSTKHREGVPRQHPDSDRSLVLLGKLTRIYLSSAESETIFQTALRDVVKFLKATSGSIVLINPETGRLEIDTAVGLSEKTRELKLVLGKGITGWVAAHGKPVRVGDVSEDSRYIEFKKKVRSELAVPLMREGSGRARSAEEGPEVIGVLNIDSNRLDAFSEEDEKLLCTIASHIGNFIQTTWFRERERRRVLELDELFQLGQTLLLAETLQEALQLIAQGGRKLLKAAFCDVLLLDGSGQYLKWRATSQPVKKELEEYRISVDNTQIGMAVHRKKPVTVYDIQKSDPIPFALRNQKNQLISLLSVPLLTGDKVFGALAFYTDKPHLFSNDEVQIVTAFATQAALAIQRSQLSEKLLSTEEELRQSERLSAIGLLAAEVAHEIRNPLTVMKMLTHNLDRELAPDDPRHKDFAVLTRKMDQMNLTVERILGLARSSEPHFEMLSLNSIVEDLILLTRHKLNNQNIRLKLTLEEKLPPIALDRAQIEQALLNLILNAFSAMSKGGTLQITTHESKSPLGQWIEIRDSGVGMTPRQRERLFQPFLTSKAKGTGLGMAIVKKIVQAHSGDISVKSRPRMGTAIRILLPHPR